MGCFLFIVSGCYISYDAHIQVYNYDNSDYRVELHRAADDRLLDILELKRYPYFESMDYFEDIASGWYYISIFRDCGNTETDRTPSFFMEEEDSRCYFIDCNGVIDGC